MRLLGPANWWMPDWTRTALFLPSLEEEQQQRARERAPAEVAVDNA